MTPAPLPQPIRSMIQDEDGYISWQRMNENALEEHDAIIRNATLAPIKEIYERFKHLDKILSAKDADSPMRMSYSEIWIAVRELCKEHP